MSRSSGLFYEMLDELIAAKDDLFVPEVKKATSPADDQARLFLEIVAFRERHGRAPDSASRSPEEMRLGVRLTAFRADEAKVQSLRDLDQYGLLIPAGPERDKIP